MPMIIAKATVARSVAWFVCGWRLVYRRGDMWVGMTLIYLVGVIVLTRIPFVGNLLLILVSPMLLAGALLTAHAGSHPGITSGMVAPDAPRHSVGALRGYVRQSVRLLGQALVDERYTLVAVICCVLTLGLVTMVKIAEYLVLGGSLASTLLTADAGGLLRLSVILGVPFVIALYVVLAMALFYLMHLTVLGELEPLGAIAKSFTACRKNAAPLLAFLAGFVTAYALIDASFRMSLWLGYLLVFTLGPILLSAFIAGTYCSYEDLFVIEPSANGR